MRRGTGEEQWEEYESGSQGHGQREGEEPGKERKGAGGEREEGITEKNPRLSTGRGAAAEGEGAERG